MAEPYASETDRLKHTVAMDKSASVYAQFPAWHEGIKGIEDNDQDDNIAQFFQGTEDDEIPEENKDEGQF
ncbi:MAG: hypothetical protein M1839_001446 [Geoglossum umbratile]|nr:MAG: hypothetical protein M1839_001446 [Geoglossum umbratile]